MKIEFVSKSTAGNIDLKGICVFEGDKFPEKNISEKLFAGKDRETLLLPAVTGKARGPVFMLGLGNKENFTLEKLRVAGADFLKQAKSLGCKRVLMEMGGTYSRFSFRELAQAAAEGAWLSDYSFTKYKSKAKAKQAIEWLGLKFDLGNPEAGAMKRALEDTVWIARAVTTARDLANEPGNVMTPPELARRAKAIASANGLRCTVLGKDRIKQLKMGGILAVSQGSSYPPQLIILENRLKSRSAPVVLVGKGITFDTGGISIKPSNDMDKMKFDMCGAAAVIGAMTAVSRLKLPVRVIGIIPVCENMPGSTAQRPGDIITCLNKKTVEVLNTDAEGRLILADALAYAVRYKPQALIDIATLTGACAVTFADLAIGLMSTDAKLAQCIKEAGDLTGERCWELPLWEEYRKLIRATYADLQNISKKYAGTITSGMFLKEFADHTKSWAHLDIAGTAYNESGPKPLSPIGATGVGVRLLTQVVRSFALKSR